MEIRIDEIENGYTVYCVGKTTFCDTKEEVIKKVKELMGFKEEEKKMNDK